MGILMKEVKYDRKIIELNKKEIKYYKNPRSNATFDDVYKNPQKTTKKELLVNAEIKTHEELYGSYVRGLGNRKLCKIKGQWFSLRDIKNIKPKIFLVYDISDDKFLKISDLKKEKFVIIVGFIFHNDR